ncbi:hypothetical protein LRH25_09450 [Ideonella azotifigens]|uniref:histidine kinase n=1 Tax=Ideonella azotifigens TaxID=513160 RepID=A0ABN1KFU7_9BURK|nr:histidine kinase dimerization/phospho-acceptor domain-containing protein [Ideonella azotifigens]MCD2340568.1 hypothetical protein [Ideonella azotifigens]
MFRSIRHGLFAALAGFTVLICVFYTGLALVISYVTEDMLIDRLLAREAEAMAAHFRLHGDVGPPGNDWIQVHRSVESLPPVVRDKVLSGHPRAEIFTDTGQHYHLRSLDLGATGEPQHVYLLADVGPLLVVSKLFREVGGGLVAAAMSLIALALVLAYRLSRRLVLPLQVLADEVRDSSPEASVNFSARQRPDEIGYLAEKLAATLAALHSALRREHAFTRDVSHELRTPLTVMNNLLGQATSRTLARQDVAQLQASLDDMRATLDVLFALARATHIATETFDLRGGIEECLLRLLENADHGAERFALDLPERIDVIGNRHLATLLLHNCLGNALFHGQPGSPFQISFADGALCVVNTVDPDRAGVVQGFSHGQNLLLRIAKAMRWELEIHAGVNDYRVHIVPLRAH